MSTLVSNRKTNKVWIADGLKAFIYSGMVVLALGCSSADRRVDDVVVYPTPTENPADEIQKLKAEIDDARGRNVDVLSPTWFASAERSLAAAQKIQQQGGDYRQLFKRTAEGRVQIQRANEISKTSEKVVQDVLKARDEARASRQEALQSGATDMEAVGNAMEDADKKLVRLTTAIENNNLDNMVDRRTEAISAYRDVQSYALRKGKLDTAKRVVQEAERQNAKKFAPKSLSYAKEVIDSAEQLINTNPRAQEDIERRSDEALFYARRALLVTQEARDVARRNPEDTVLWFEQGLSSIAETAGAEDLRDEKFDAQIDALKGHVASFRSSDQQRMSAYPPASAPQDQSQQQAAAAASASQQAAQSAQQAADRANQAADKAARSAEQTSEKSAQQADSTSGRKKAASQKGKTTSSRSKTTSQKTAGGTTVIRPRGDDKVTVTVEPGRKSDSMKERQTTQPQREERM